MSFDLIPTKRSQTSTFCVSFLIHSSIFFLLFPTSIGQSAGALNRNFASIAVSSSSSSTPQPPFVHHYANENQRIQIAASSPAFELSQRRQFADRSSQQPQETSLVEENPLPSCSVIPRLLCCTSRVLAKCYDGCVDHVRQRCQHKLRQIDHFSQTDKVVDHEISQPLPPAALENDADLLPTGHLNPPVRFISSVNQPALQPPPSRSSPPKAQAYIVDRDIELPAAGGFIEPLIVDTTLVPSTTTEQSIESQKMAEMLREHKPEVANNQSVGIFDAYAPKRISTNECGTADSQPPFLPCTPRQLTDRVFESCCKQRVPEQCQSLCSYEHREQIASEKLIRAVQDDGCDLKWLSAILSCANQDHDNRPCCQHLGLASEELGAGDRCLRMCSVGSSGIQTIGAVEQNDLVCLSNWNVIMYCARSAIRVES
ncbi:DB domain-containing protein [Aphelenchoides besseyi]|nr:DB domain-containing protein [Aphelenchoides besseyi]KAI6217636.1 DB domain-containing protein [Aphelenchoides besseyi]